MGMRYRVLMTSAYAESFDPGADVAVGHSVTVRPTGRPALRLVTPIDWAAGELARAFVRYAPPESLDPAAGLATGREPGGVYSRVFRAAGCRFGDAEKRAIALVQVVDHVLAELYDQLGEDAELVAVVPQLRQDMVRAARADQVAAVRATPGLPAEWVDTVATEPDWLHAHPAGATGNLLV